jgi:excisionase family DNA binding protein
VSVAVPELLTVDALASAWHVSRATIWRLVREQGLPAIRPHSELRFRREDVERWLDSRQVTRFGEGSQNPSPSGAPGENAQEKADGTASVQGWS